MLQRKQQYQKTRTVTSLLFCVLCSVQIAYCSDHSDLRVLEKTMDQNKVNINYIKRPESAQTTAPGSLPQHSKNKGIRAIGSIMRNLSLKYDEFGAPVTINQSNINGNAHLFMNRFQSIFDFNHNQIAGNLLLFEAIFDKEFLFSFNRVRGNTELSTLHFKNDAEFYNNLYEKNVMINLSSFDGKALFNHSTYNSNLSILNNTFHDDVSFDGAKFNRDVSLRGSTFYKNVSFDNALLPHKLDFSHVTVKGPPIELNNAKASHIGKYVLINVYDTDINKINFSYTHFKLVFPDVATQQDIINIYTKLLEKYKREGMDRSFKQLYREFREYELLVNKQNVMNLLQKHWWDYGLDKNRLFGWFLLIMTILSLVNCLFYNTLITKYFNVYFLDKVEPDIACQQNAALNYIYNIPRAIFLTIFLVFASFLQPLVGEEKIFKTDHFLINSYVLFINCLGYVFLLFTLDIIMT